MTKVAARNNATLLTDYGASVAKIRDALLGSQEKDDRQMIFQLTDEENEEDDMRAKRFNDGKVRYSLLPTDALTEEAKVWMGGEAKYGRNNWEKLWGEDTRNVCLDSLMRHALAIQAGEDTDPESGLPHAAHIRCNAAMLIRDYLQRTAEAARPDEDDPAAAITEGVRSPGGLIRVGDRIKWGLGGFTVTVTDIAAGKVFWISDKNLRGNVHEASLEAAYRKGLWTFVSADGSDT